MVMFVTRSVLTSDILIPNVEKGGSVVNRQSIHGPFTMFARFDGLGRYIRRSGSFA